MTNTQIPEQKTQEFPGLEQLSQKIFQIPYADLTPNLKRCIRSKAAEAAAGDMLAALKEVEMLVKECEELHPVYQNTLETLRAVIAKAEGR